MEKDENGNKLCDDCKQKYKEGKFFWMCEICSKIFEPNDKVGLDSKKE